MIYKTFIRSKLEQSALVWHSSLSNCNVIDLKRVQKSALKVILKEKYQDYKSAMNKLNIESLYHRRELLCFKFAKKSLKLPHFKKMFPVQKNLHNMEKRNKNKFVVNSTKTDRYMYMKSSIPSMQRLLNKHENIFEKALKNLVPVIVPNEFYLRGSLVEKI